jgi:hypothetical protein
MLFNSYIDIKILPIMNYVAIIVGALSVMVLGYIWYNPKVFGQSWMKGAGLTEEDMKKANPMVMVGALLMALVIAWAMSRYATHTEPGMSQFVHGLYHGFMPSIMFVAPVLVSKGLFEKKELSWILLGAVYWVLAITLVGGIVYALTPIVEAAG